MPEEDARALRAVVGTNQATPTQEHAARYRSRNLAIDRDELTHPLRRRLNPAALAADSSGNQADVAHPTGQLPAGSATRRRLNRKTSNAVYDGDDADVGSGGLLSFLRRCQTVAKARQDAMQPDVIPSDTGVVDDIKKAYELINKDYST